MGRQCLLWVGLHLPPRVRPVILVAIFIPMEWEFTIPTLTVRVHFQDVSMMIPVSIAAPGIASPVEFLIPVRMMMPLAQQVPVPGLPKPQSL